MTERPTYDLLAFDFDGVLADSVDVKTRAFAQLYEPHGDAVADRVVAHHLANGGMPRFEKFRIYHRDFLGRTISEDEVTALSLRFSDLVMEGVVASDWIPGAREMLDRHAGTVPMHVVSGTPEDELQRIIERRGMTAFFVTVRGSPTGKGEHLKAILESAGIAGEQALMVGDAMADLNGARAAGMEFLGCVAAGADSPFPAGTPVVADLHGLDYRP